MNGGKHVVFATSGSLGDLHPFLALGTELQRRGHRVSIATSIDHRAAVQEAALGFRHMRPDPDNTPDFHARYMHPRTGGRFVYRHHLGPAIRSSHADLLQATADADLLVSQSLMAMAAPLVAARSGMPWISAVLQPMAFFSLQEQPGYLPSRLLSWLCGRSVRLHGRVMHYVRKHTEGWVRPVTDFRKELGLCPKPHPLFEGQHSPQAVLAMFSPLFGQPQRDWPASAVQTGTALYQHGMQHHDERLAHFLAQDSRPLAIFTLSSAASNDAGDFYLQAMAAAQALDLRALLIMGGLATAVRLPDALPSPLPALTMRVDYAAFEQVFPHAAVIAHSGGVATSFKALQSGKPQIIVPHAHDQFDNALRLQSLGVARRLARRPGKRALMAALSSVLADAGMRERAAALALQACKEDGVGRACDVIERRLQHA